ncbi:MAG: sulfatase-like hydrolase/transferase, partial [Rhodobacteraceae bacterium]|nr:sulfatase-like hydrolase/transferase [Paracoccaceae bacterium]
SMPCMMSRLTKTHYSYGAGRAEENLLDVLTHAGFHVEWFDNNTGDLGVAQRIKSTMLTDQKDPVSCAKGECEDSIFFKPLQEQLNKATGNTVIVLHQIGSHGPAYFLRYSDAYERFKPACKSAAFSDCTTDEIVNAYDNTIAFTDHFLSTIIDMLKDQDKALTAMYYVSDHGESLGENGVYLHAAPYFMAPVQQTHVPMVLWTSKPFADQFALNDACLRGKVSAPLSHDNLFHTILGLLNVETKVHVPALDLTDGCKNG